MSDAPSLCYIEAAQQYAAGQISFQAYIHHLFAHVNGTRHAADKDLNPFDVQGADTFAGSVECLASTLQEPIDSQPFEDVFVAYQAGDVEQVAARMQALGPHEFLTRLALAQRALLDRRADVLKLCLDAGIRFEGCFIDVADSVDREKDPLTWKVLDEDERFGVLYPRDRKIDTGSQDRVPW